MILADSVTFFFFLMGPVLQMSNESRTPFISLCVFPCWRPGQVCEE